MDAPSYHFQPAQQPYRRVGLLCVWLVVIAGLAVLWLWKTPSVQVLSVQSGSMQPLIHKGDAIVVKPITFSADNKGALAVGDIISYHSAKDMRLVITHRIRFIDRQRGLVTTKGDSNVTADTPITNDQIIGRVSQHINGLGYVIDCLHSPPGLILVIYLPALIAIVLEMRRLTAYFRLTYVLHV